MGATIEEENPSKNDFREFTTRLLEDLDALEILLESGRFLETPRHIGAEQEVFLVDRDHRPIPVAADVLAILDDDRYTTELAAYNL